MAYVPYQLADASAKSQVDILTDDSNQYTLFHCSKNYYAYSIHTYIYFVPRYIRVCHSNTSVQKSGHVQLRLIRIPKRQYAAVLR